MWDELSTPAVLAHRGDCKHAPENTLAAFRQAAKMGVDGIEFDVKLTADGKVIVLHDQTLDRTTNGHGDVSSFTLAALQELNASVRFPELVPPEKIPTLDEVFEFAGDRLYMNVELKNYSTPFDRLVPAVVEHVKRHGLEKRVFFSSFNPFSLRIAHRLLPSVPCGLLTLPRAAGFLGRTFGWRGQLEALNPHLASLTPYLVDQVHAGGKRVYVWTVNAEADILHVIDLGVDGIITDDPALALRLLGRVQ